MSQVTTVRLAQAVDKNWRGAFDILVTPTDHQPVALASRTSGLIEPNFLSYAGNGGISLAQLSTIQQLTGVAVAAPVATIGYMTSDAVAPDLYISRSELPAHPTVYHLTLRATTSDGLRSIAVSTQTLDVVLGPADLSLPTLPFISSNGDMAWDPSGVHLIFSDLPPQVTPVVAVDPSAEEALLGPSFSFLDQLKIPTSKLTVATFEARRIPAEFALAATQLSTLQSDASKRGDVASSTSTDGSAAQKPVVPVVVSNHLSYPLRITVNIQQMGEPLNSYPTGATLKEKIDAARKSAGTALHGTAVASLDASARLRGFEPPSLTVLWPGSDQPNGTSYSTQASSSLATQIAGRAAYKGIAGPDNDVPAYRIQPRGMVGFDGQAPSGSSALSQSYRQFEAVPFAIANAGEGVGEDAAAHPFFVAPVGTFNLAGLSLPDNPLTHVPLGAYEPVSGRLVMSNGSVGARVTPTENPLGFLTGPPEVMTTIHEAATLRGPSPIDAVRVRVAGLRGFGPTAENKVATVASKIAQLGLNVRIVAGSSPHAVDVYVPAYYPSGKDLGWVREEWTSLGAAQISSAALSRGEETLLLLSLVVAMLLAASLAYANLNTKRNNLRVWNSLGWPRWRQAWWLVSDSCLGGGAIVVAVVLGSVLFNRAGTALLAGVGVGVVLVLTELVAAVVLLTGRQELAARRRASRRFSNGRISRFAGYARRTAFRAPSLVLLTAMGVGVSAAAISLAAGSLRSSGHTVAGTMLGRYLNSTLVVVHAISIVLLVVAGQVAAIIATRSWHQRRRSEVASLAAAGWTFRHIVRVLRIERALIALLGLIVALCCVIVLELVGVNQIGAWTGPVLLLLCGSYIVLGEGSARLFVRGLWPEP
jgi:hypothetical protein